MMSGNKPGNPKIGQPVCLRNLQRRLDLNGCLAFVEAYEPGEKVVLVLAATHEVVRTNIANIAGVQGRATPSRGDPAIDCMCMASGSGFLASRRPALEDGATVVAPVGGHCRNSQ